MPTTLKAKVAKGAVWAFAEQFGTQFVNLAMGIVLARLLTPAEYGTVALVTIIIAIAQVIAESGFGQALVQKRAVDEVDVSSVFFAGAVLSVAAYGLLALAAPAVAAYYAIPVLKPILRVLALNILFCTLSSVLNAELCREMRFRDTCRVSVTVAAASFAVGVALAYGGYGVWALVWSSVLGNAVGVLVRLHYTTWRPTRRISLSRLRPLFAYGGNIMANSLVTAVFDNLYGIVIGKFYRPDDLAYVNKGRNIPTLVSANVSSSFIEVAFPALVQMQDDLPRLRFAASRLLVVSYSVLAPVLTMLAVFAPQLIPLLYGDQWQASVPYMQLMCLLLVWWPVGAVNQLAIKAIGRSDLILKLGLFKNFLSLAVLALCLTQSVMTWMVVCTFLYGPLSGLVYAVGGSRLIGYSLRRQLLDMLPPTALCAAVAVPLFLVGRLLPATSAVARAGGLALQGLLAVALFIGSMVLFRMRALRELSGLLEARLLPKFPWLGRVVVHLNRGDAQEVA